MLPEAPPQDRRRNTYPLSTIDLCRGLYANDWTPVQICRYLAEQGIANTCETTVRRWVIPRYDEAQRAWNRDSYHRRQPQRPPAKAEPMTPANLYARMRQLRSAGLTYSGIAVVMNLDHGLALTPDTARSVLRGKRLSRTLARHLMPETA